MPHVVIEEALDLALACQGIKIAAVRNGSEILKVVDVYSSRSGHAALVDSVVVEEGRSQSFFVLPKRPADHGAPASGDRSPLVPPPPFPRELPKKTMVYYTRLFNGLSPARK